MTALLSALTRPPEASASEPGWPTAVSQLPQPEPEEAQHADPQHGLAHAVPGQRRRAPVWSALLPAVPKPQATCRAIHPMTRCSTPLMA